MIEYIKGELVDATPAWVVVECNGLGYGINVSGKKGGQTLYI